MTRKLYSRKGTLLGTLTYPDHYDRILLKNRYVQFALYDRTKISYFDPSPLTAAAIKTAVIEKCHQHDEAIHLYGTTPEEIEKFPGFSFAPGAGYLRSLME